MLMLANTTDKLQLVTDAARTVDVSVHYGDYASGSVSFNRQLTGITTATTTDILAAPDASTTRKVKAVTIRNKDSSAVLVTVLYDANGTDYEITEESLNAGDELHYIEGVGWFVKRASSEDELFRQLDADAAGQNVNTAQPWFPTNGSVAVEAGARYHFEGSLYITRAAGTTSHTTGMGFGGTATFTEFMAQYNCGEGDVATLADDDVIASDSNANIQVKAASTSATEAIKAKVQGGCLINAAGTFIPQFTYSAAPGGAPTIKACSWFIMRKDPAMRGNWT